MKDLEDVTMDRVVLGELRTVEGKLRSLSLRVRDASLLNVTGKVEGRMRSGWSTLR